ncbi:MAG: hypothetical protein ACRD52_19985, partial [Candidatus Acidiferrales bacterium]
ISVNTILRLKNLFEENKSLYDRKRNSHRRRNRDQAILNFFGLNPTKSISDAVRDIHYGHLLRRRVSRGTVHRTLKIYKLFPFHILPLQHLTAAQKELRFQFVSHLTIRQQDNDPDLFQKILWTDEATFTTSGIFNRHNTHYWAVENPRKYKTIKFQGRSSIHVWCGIINNNILGPIFYNGTLNGQRYHQFLQNEIENFLDELPLEEYRNLIWQQDGAPPHAVRDVVQFLNQRHHEWIGRNGTISWPPNSPDLSLLDTFLWGHLKNVVYQQRNENIEEIMAKIVNEINRLNQENDILIASSERLQRGYRSCFENNGGHIEHLNY